MHIAHIHYRMVMRLFTLILSLVLVAPMVGFAQECRIPSKVQAGKGLSEYRLRQGDVICLNDGSSLTAKKVRNGQVTLSLTGKAKATKRLDTKTKSAKVGGFRVRLKSSVSRASNAMVTVELTAANEDSDELDFTVVKPAPRMCAQMEGVCTMEFKPVCGIDLNGEFKSYSNACKAAEACAEIVETSLCAR